MRIIISPAKKMNVDTDSLPVRDFPAFLEQTENVAAASAVAFLRLGQIDPKP